jgi:methionyl-tRNA formyltransferase
MPTCILLTSKDTLWLVEHAQNELSKNFEILGTWRMNRKSPTLNSIRAEFEHIPQVDYIFNFLSPKLVPAWLLAKAKVASINFHPGSYQYPGIGSASYSIFDKRESYGVSAHYMTEKIDEGGIIAERYFKQNPEWACSELFENALKECCSLLKDVINLLIQNPNPPVVRTWSRSPVTRREFEEWMIINDDDSSDVVDRKIKALNHPVFPGPFVMKNGYLFSYYQKG